VLVRVSTLIRRISVSSVLVRTLCVIPGAANHGRSLHRARLSRHLPDLTLYESPLLASLGELAGMTLPVFSRREAARRFLRASPLRFNLLGSGWRARKISELEAGVLLARCPDGIQGIALDPSPETLFGECATEPLAEVT
jgi:hypothetical protein